MSIRFILGRAGSGKSEQCLSEIRWRLRESPDGAPLILIMPEQATFQGEHALVTTPGLSGILRAQVLSFRRLAYRVMQETGGYARTWIDENGKKMLLCKAVQSCRGRLRLFGRQAEQMGFINKLNEMFEELKRYCVSSEQLAEQMQFLRLGEKSAGLLADKLYDIQSIYREYEAILSSGYNEPEDLLTWLARNVSLSGYVRDAEIWIDGFNGFTPQEYAVIEQLMKHARRLNVALCLDKEYGPDDVLDELDLFYPTASTMIKLVGMAGHLGVAKEETLLLKDRPRFAGNPQLAHLEEHFGSALPWKDEYVETGAGESKDVGIALVAAVNRRAEAEGVAREILRLVRDEGYRWRDIAVMLRTPEVYQDLLKTVFEDYGIPYFLDQKREALHHPLMEFIRSALEVVRFHWRYDAVFRCVKTELLYPLDPPSENRIQEGEDEWRRGMDLLENYVLAYGIQGTKWTDPRFWNFGEKEQLKRIHAFRDMLTHPLLAFQNRLNRSSTVSEMAEALYLLLEEAGVPRRLKRWHDECIDRGEPEKAKEHMQIWERTMDVLDQLTEWMGGDSVPLERFMELLETGLAGIRLAHVPPALDQVLIGSMERTRSGAKKCCFILGVNEGLIPPSMPENGILTEDEREILAQTGMELAPGSRRRLLDEQFLLYTALCTPSRRLWLSYALADEEGKALLPSEIIQRIKRLFPQLKEVLIRAEPDPEMDMDEQRKFIVHPQRAMTYLIVQLRHLLRGFPMAGHWWEVYEWLRLHPDWRDQLRSLLASLGYSNREEKLSLETSRQLYGNLLRTSVSRMEMFAGCPFAHFSAYGLKLKERKMYRLEPPDVGQLFHSVLKHIAEEAAKEGLDWGSLTKEQLRARAEEAVDLLSPKLQGEILLSSHRHHYISKKLKDVLGSAAVMLGKHLSQGSFAPAGLELGFGPGEPLSPLEFTLPGDIKMEVVGRIDRVDKALLEDGTFVRIIDYKSGEKDLRLEEIYYGLSLQMITYLDVVLSSSRRWFGTEAEPAGVLYFRVHNPVLQVPHVLAPEKLEEMWMKSFRMKGLITAEQKIAKEMDRSLETGRSFIIPAALNKNGEFRKGSSVATRKQWDNLRRFVRNKIRRIGEEMASGVVDIQPYKLGKKTPCMHCPFKPVCQFDSLLEGNRYRLLDPKDRETLWQYIEKGGEERGEENT